MKPKHVKRSGEDGSHYRLPEGKDTKHSEGEPRDAYLPADTERDLYQYARDNNLDDDEPYLDLGVSTVRQIVTRTVEAAADRTGKMDFHDVSSHDFRRRFAQRLLVDGAMNPRVVVPVGGWSSFAAIEPYLNIPSEDVINEAFSEANL